MADAAHFPFSSDQMGSGNLQEVNEVVIYDKEKEIFCILYYLFILLYYF